MGSGDTGRTPRDKDRNGMDTQNYDDDVINDTAAEEIHLEIG